VNKPDATSKPDNPRELRLRRAEEMKLAGFDGAQQAAFIDMQFQAQHADYRRRFPDANFSVVLHEGEPVGRLYVARSADEIRILDVTILAAHRNAGIGTALITELLAEAREAKRPVRIYVDSHCPAMRLFERLGFSKIAEQSLISLLEWRPSD
jgi:GNAT superfamily N-acetyltransferase